MRYKKSMLSVLCALGLLACRGGRPGGRLVRVRQGGEVRRAELGERTLLTELMQFVLAKGYGCTTDSLPGNSITMEQALSTNDIQVFAEEWIGRSDAWNKAAAAGKVVGVGEPIVGAVEGWYVPRYVIEGDPQRKLEAKAPKLRSIADLAQYAEVFRDPEEPGKGASTIARPAGPASWRTARC